MMIALEVEKPFEMENMGIIRQGISFLMIVLITGTNHYTQLKMGIKSVN